MFDYKKIRNCFVILALFLGAFVLHLAMINGVIVLSLINETLGKVLSLCGINGIYVTEKPGYMFPLYVAYIFLLIIIACGLTFLLQSSLKSFKTKS